MAMCPAARDFGPLASNFFAGILTDFKENCALQRSKGLPVGLVDMFQTSPRALLSNGDSRRETGKKAPGFPGGKPSAENGGFLLSMPPRRGGGGSPAAAAAAAVSVLRVVPEERGDGDINGIGSVGPGGQRVDAGVVVPAGIATAAIAAALIVTTTHKRNPQSIGLQGECLPTAQYMRA